MNILMIAPEPFFQPRGTPISVYFRTTALGELGHRTDLFTYPLGEDVAIKNLRVFRVPNILGLRRIKIGPSLAKIPLDALLFLRASFALCRRRYDLVFTHEEAALLGLVLSKVWRLPHIYDMHSRLPQQLENFEFSRSRLLKRLFARMERLILRTAHAVIVICQDLLQYVQKKGFGAKAVFLENFIDFADFEPSLFPLDVVWRKKKDIAPHGEKIILYAGNFEPYQGIPLLIEAFAQMTDPAVLLIVGGSKNDHETARRQAAGLGIGRSLVFVEKVPPSQVALYTALADVLVSPRLSGTNTPLKIYSFLTASSMFLKLNRNCRKVWNAKSGWITADISLSSIPKP